MRDIIKPRKQLRILDSIFNGFIAAQVVAFLMLFLFLSFGFNRPDRHLSPIVDKGCTAIVALTFPVVAIIHFCWPRPNKPTEESTKIKANDEATRAPEELP